MEESYIKRGYVDPDTAKMKTYKDDDKIHTPATRVDAVALPSAVVHGQKTVSAAGTAEALGSDTALSSGVHVKALAGNSGNVYVGGSGVDSSDGYVLAAGEEVFIEIDNLNKVYLDVDTNGEGASYIGS